MPRKRRRTPPLWKYRLRRWVRANFAQALLEAVRDFEAGKVSQPEYDRIKAGLPFRLRDAMTACGMDFSNRYDYAKAQGFFADERKRLEDALVVFVQDPRYAEMKRRGASEDEIFYAFMIGALEHSVYPLFADPDDDNRFKVLERPDYLYLVQLRASAIASDGVRGNTTRSAVRSRDWADRADRDVAGQRSGRCETSPSRSGGERLWGSSAATARASPPYSRSSAASLPRRRGVPTSAAGSAACSRSAPASISN